MRINTVLFFKSFLSSKNSYEIVLNKLPMCKKFLIIFVKIIYKHIYSKRYKKFVIKNYLSEDGRIGSTRKASPHLDKNCTGIICLM